MQECLMQVKAVEGGQGKNGKGAKAGEGEGSPRGGRTEHKSGAIIQDMRAVL